MLVYPFWKIVHAFIYSIVPFFILLATNAFFIYKTAKSAKSVSGHISAKSSRIDKQNSMNIMIVLTTVMFLVTTAPYSIASMFFFSSLTPSNLVVYLLSDLSFTYHSLNFVVFYFCNRLFRSEVKSLWREMRSLVYLSPSTNRIDNVEGSTQATATQKNMNESFNRDY